MYMYMYMYYTLPSPRGEISNAALWLANEYRGCKFTTRILVSVILFFSFLPSLDGTIPGCIKVGGIRIWPMFDIYLAHEVRI